MCWNSIIGASSALLQLHSYAHAFIPAGMDRIRSSRALAIGMSKKDLSTTSVTLLQCHHGMKKRCLILFDTTTVAELNDTKEVADPWESLEEIETRAPISATASTTTTTTPSSTWFEDALLESSTEYSESSKETTNQNETLEQMEMEDLTLYFC